MPRPSSWAHKRLTIVRASRPFSGFTSRSASCFIRSARSGRIDAPQLGIDEADLGHLAGRLVAAVDFQFAVGKHRGQAVGFGQLPMVDEAVVAARALQVRAQEHLRKILRGLHRRRLAGIDHAAPNDALGETGRAGHGADQLVDELVVMQVVVQRLVEPIGNLLATAIDEAGPAIRIAKQVAPERQPVVGVGPAIVEQPGHQSGPLVGTRIALELAQLRHAGQQSHQVQINTPGEQAIVHGSARRDMLLGIVRLQNQVDRVGQVRTGRSRRHLRPARREGRAAEAEVDLGRPRQTLVDPAAQQCRLRGRKLGALGRHPPLGIVRGDQLEEQAVARLAGSRGRTALAPRDERLPSFERQSAPILAPAVALQAVLLQNRLDVPGKVDLGRLGRRSRAVRDGGSSGKRRQNRGSQPQAR